MSWLSPKRRRTTGNLKTLPNGDQQPSSVQPPPATGSSNDDSVTVDSNAISLPTRPRIQPTAALHEKKIPGQSTAKRPTTLARPLSQPLMSTATLPSGDGTANDDDGNGDLFYAYARKANDLQSRYLLTFANAVVANEWWSLLQEHFHDVSRPSPQLFSFKDPELLLKAWKNTSFAHLKSKWMYISFSDTASNQLGGAAQGIIPIQDAAGNLLGGGAPANSGEVKQAREETREAKQEISRLEERFERMMGAIEKNGDRMASLLEERQERIDAKDQDYGRSDQSELSSHLEKITELLAKNSEYVQGLEKRQASNEKAIREELKKLNAKPKEKGPNISQLSSHLDRIQKMMGQSITDRKDGSIAESRPVQIDLSPLTERLAKVQEAVEQNSALVKELLDEGANSESRAVTSFWGKTTPIEHPQQQFQPLDLSPLTEHLEKIHHAIEQQSNHMQALVGFASGGDEESGSAGGGGGSSSSLATTGYAGGDTAERSLAPLGEHLEQIYNAIEQGNTQAQKHWAQQEEQQQRSQQALPIDLKPLLEAQDRTRLAVEAGNKVDMGPLVGMFDGLIEHMRSLREDSQSVDSHLQELIRKQNELTDTFVVGGSRTLDAGPLAEKLDQVNEHLEILREWSEFSAERWQEFIDARGIEMEERRGDVKAEMGMLEGKFDALSEHMQALRASSNTSTHRLHELLQKPQQEVQTSSRPPSSSSDIDLTPLNDRLTRIHDSLERQVVVVRGGGGVGPEHDDEDHDDDGNGIQGGRRGGARAQSSANLTSGAGDPKFLITALTSHLSKIQAVTDTNAQQLSRLLHTFSAPTGVTKPHHHQRKPPQQPNHHPHNPAPPAESLSDPAPISRHTTTPAAAASAVAAQQDHRLEATHSQVRELMAGQREMIDAVRELAKSIRAEKGGSCEHVVIPPPRKVGRKVVGFVYDGKGRGGG
ncbi:hypothetical protein KC343_g6518 [Hortaea werneckii]|uniref:Uncharacterized protein n=1 Tax=Hortaea werneckii TaxID=91943 RepID=A0A3M7GY66_HORWE|nr:hypothetical protein KC323_g6234 [Hortaea werneckii]KAI7571630.1 hypothetical protein KC317_g1466 [Hortaea werneckii]KAI7625776.1 hypothetical protein KC343_g6518 [Hortaea werneckii]KAI7721689.1 hypothetical protein KC322_g1559 [Hortaea werneckii]RMZ06006.1 hypothetical protein D0864_02335 [Hortaea werneckii]